MDADPRNCVRDNAISTVLTRLLRALGDVEWRATADRAGAAHTWLLHGSNPVAAFCWWGLVVADARALGCGRVELLVRESGTEGTWEVLTVVDL